MNNKIAKMQYIKDNVFHKTIARYRHYEIMNLTSVVVLKKTIIVYELNSNIMKDIMKDL